VTQRFTSIVRRVWGILLQALAHDYTLHWS